AVTRFYWNEVEKAAVTFRNGQTQPIQYRNIREYVTEEANPENRKEVNIVEGLKATASTLNHLVTFLTEERSKGDQAIRDILLSTHPAFPAVKNAAKIPYRVIFYTFDELDALLSARNFKRDEIFAMREDCDDWDNVKAGYGIRVSKHIFDEDGKLKIFTPDEWNSEWVESYTLRKSADDGNDDIPF
ncbi:MAG: hypothetical protein ACP5VS_17255, partial [Desulfomonilaceae bacterium]